MMVAVPTTAELTERGVRLTRLFDAPPELVFKVWSDPRHLDAWWGPDGFRNETQSMEFAPGGEWRYTMHGPDGKAWPNWIRYAEIAEPARIAYDHGGEIGEPAHFRGLILFEDLDGQTRLSMVLVFDTTEARDATLKYGAVDGGKQTLAKLEAYVLGRQGGGG